MQSNGTGEPHPSTSGYVQRSGSWRRSHSGPGELTRADAEAVLATGVSEQALVDAIHVAALFNMIDRLADSFGWHVPPDEAFHARSQAMLESGYTLMTL